MNLLSRLVGRPEERAGVVEIFPTWANQTERVGAALRDAYRINSTVHACVNARQRVFSEADFAIRRRSTGDLVLDHAALDVLRSPWPGATGTELLKRMELDASLSGNAFVYRANRSLLQPLDPRKVEVLSNGREKIGYNYWPNGYGNGTARGLMLEEVAHWAPLPHPDDRFVGASWVEVVATELRTDIKMVRHQERFFDNAATPNLFVKVEGKMTPEARDRLRTELESRYAGVSNAWKTLVMDAGADLRVVGADFEQMDYVNALSSVEARIASAAGVPPIIIALKAGLDAATYSNYAMAMRAFADHLIRPNWNSVVAALGQIVPTPRGSELWYDDRQVAALRQDKTDEAKVLQIQAAAIRQLIDGGFDPDAVVEAITANEIERLKGRHSGNVSVQLQPADPAEQSADQAEEDADVPDGGEEAEQPL